MVSSLLMVCISEFLMNLSFTINLFMYFTTTLLSVLPESILQHNGALPVFLIVMLAKSHLKKYLPHFAQEGY